MKSVKVYVENPTIRQRFTVWYYNFMLWFASKIYSGDELIEERKDLLKSFYNELKKLS